MGRDGITGLVVLIASLALYWATLAIEQNPLVPVSPALYPRIILGTTAALAALLVAADVITHRRGRPAVAAAHGARYGLVIALFAVFGVYVLALPLVGFRVATAGFVAVMQAVLEPPRGARAWVRVAIVALVATGATYYIFDQYLDVLLPRGRWTDF